MLFKIYQITVCFILLQEACNTAPQEGIGFCQRRVLQLQSQIGFVVSQARLEISIIITGIRNNLDGVRFNINYQLTELNRQINQSGKNPEICLDQFKETLGKINNQDLNFCYVNADIDILNLEIEKITNLVKSTSEICIDCKKKFRKACQLNRRIMCINAAIINIRRQVENHINEVSLGAIIVQNKSSRCAQEIEDEQSEVIRTAASDFDKCTQSQCQRN